MAVQVADVRGSGRCGGHTSKRRSLTRHLMTLRFWSSVAVAGWMASAAVAMLAAAPAQSVPAAASTQTSPVPAVVKQYCVTCHNERTKTAGLSLETVDASNVPANAELWERVIRKLERRAMPPLGARHPDESTYVS